MRSIETENPRPVDLGHLPESPLVSVLMCNFNYARFIPASLGSLVAQTYPRFEVVVCDNGSTDASMAVLQQWAASDTRISVS